MRYWIIDCGATLNADSVATAARVGFKRVLVYPNHANMDSVVSACRNHNIGLIVMVAGWPGVARNHPEMAFRDHTGKSSFDSTDTIAAPWPSLWHPQAVNLIRGQFKRAALAAGDTLAGFAIGTGSGDASVMPINWRGCPNGHHLSQSYWCFDKWALLAYKDMYGNGTMPAAHPEDDSNFRTLRFIQDGLLNRMNELAVLAAEYGNEIWPMILPFGSNSYLNMAAGYAHGLHGKFAKWAHEFSTDHNRRVGFLIPYVFGEDGVGLPDQVATAASMSDPRGNACMCLVGAEVGGEDWQERLRLNSRRVRDLGLTGLICSPSHVTSAENETQVHDILQEVQ